MQNLDKRITAHLIPYKINKEGFFVYLQKRSGTASRNPGWYTIFGGGFEGEEKPEQAMLREIKEELNFIPSDYFYLGEYNDDYSISYYYAVLVSNEFESDIKINEGEYGKFLSLDEMKSETKLSENNKRVLADLYKKVTNPSII